MSLLRSYFSFSSKFCGEDKGTANGWQMRSTDKGILSINPLIDKRAEFADCVPLHWMRLFFFAAEMKNVIKL